MAAVVRNNYGCTMRDSSYESTVVRRTSSSPLLILHHTRYVIPGSGPSFTINMISYEYYSSLQTLDLLNFVFLRDCPSLASQSSNFHITCGTFPAFLCFPASFEIRNANNSAYRYTSTSDLYMPSETTLLDHMHAQFRSIRLYMAQQRSVVPCAAVRSHAVRCRALRCGAVSLRCELSFEHRAVPGVMRVVVYGVLLFLFFLFL